MRRDDDRLRPICACRLCGSADVDAYFDFGTVPLGNDLRTDSPSALSSPAFPLCVNRCAGCGHFQLAHAVAPELLYATNYTYLSGVGPSFIRHFSEYSGWVVDRCGISGSSLIVDVGSNDGTCLAAFKARGFAVCGVDPAEIPARVANESGIPTLNRFFDDAAVDEIVDRFGHADFVTSHNVLAHVDDLAGVFRCIHRLLRQGGFFAFEVGYFREVVEKGCFDTTYHEHLDYHHAGPLVRHLTELGFDVIELGVTPVQGGSVRLLLRKSGLGVISDQAAAFLQDESQSVLFDRVRLASWPAEIKARMDRFGALVRDAAAAGKSVVGYGAPTKATLLMRMADLDTRQVAFIVEDNSFKVGRFMPSTGIPIRDTAELRRRRPDVIVILAWNFAEDILGKLRSSVDWPAEYIVPLPNLQRGFL